MNLTLIRKLQNKKKTIVRDKLRQLKKSIHKNRRTDIYDNKN